ncbi:L,D-transpeptidase [Candidatus Kaiserbacteria bacterium]|nr:MAG: L,D-transpeptidase [Candidatus Kaiserbacteria bacterium]
MDRSTEKQVKRILLRMFSFLCILACLYALWIFYQGSRNSNQGTVPGSIEAVITPSTPKAKIDEGTEVPPPKKLFTFITIKDSCDVHFLGECVRVRGGPGVSFPVVTKLRNNILLMVSTTTVEADGHTWYQIVFDESLAYPERVASKWYVAGDFVDIFTDEGNKTIWENESATTTKRVIVDRSEQKLYAYEGETPFMEISISTGLELSPTPRGTFTVFKMTPTRYMQGPLPGYTDVYDLPGVPWNLYFTNEGAVIHGAYWHDSFGIPYSHGCVNLLPSDAGKLYAWAELGMKVTVRD